MLLGVSIRWFSKGCSLEVFEYLKVFNKHPVDLFVTGGCFDRTYASSLTLVSRDCTSTGIWTVERSGLDVRMFLWICLVFGLWFSVFSGFLVVFCYLAWLGWGTGKTRSIKQDPYCTKPTNQSCCLLLSSILCQQAPPSGGSLLVRPRHPSASLNQPARQRKSLLEERLKDLDRRCPAGMSPWWFVFGFFFLWFWLWNSIKTTSLTSRTAFLLAWEYNQLLSLVCLPDPSYPSYLKAPLGASAGGSWSITKFQGVEGTSEWRNSCGELVSRLCVFFVFSSHGPLIGSFFFWGGVFV